MNRISAQSAPIFSLGFTLARATPRPHPLAPWVPPTLPQRAAGMRVALGGLVFSLGSRQAPLSNTATSKTKDQVPSG